MKVLLSIKPVHTFNILGGKKQFEFRRKIFTRRDIKTVVIYCTMPVGKIVGEFDIKDILEDTPSRIWRITEEGSGISKDYFDDYFKDRHHAYAIRIGTVRRYKKHVNPDDMLEDFTPPQSYMYVGSDRLKNSTRQLAFL